METDETAKKPDLIKMPVNSEEEREAITHLEQEVSAGGVSSGDQSLHLHQAKLQPSLSRVRLLLMLGALVQRGCR